MSITSQTFHIIESINNLKSEKRELEDLNSELYEHFCNTQDEDVENEIKTQFNANDQRIQKIENALDEIRRAL